MTDRKLLGGGYQSSIETRNRAQALRRERYLNQETPTNGHNFDVDMESPTSLTNIGNLKIADDSATTTPLAKQLSPRHMKLSEPIRNLFLPEGTTSNTDDNDDEDVKSTIPVTNHTKTLQNQVKSPNLGQNIEFLKENIENCPSELSESKIHLRNPIVEKVVIDSDVVITIRTQGPNVRRRMAPIVDLREKTKSKKPRRTKVVAAAAAVTTVVDESHEETLGPTRSQTRSKQQQQVAVAECEIDSQVVKGQKSNTNTRIAKKRKQIKSVKSGSGGKGAKRASTPEATLEMVKRGRGRPRKWSSVSQPTTESKSMTVGSEEKSGQQRGQFGKECCGSVIVECSQESVNVGHVGDLVIEIDAPVQRENLELPASSSTIVTKQEKSEDTSADQEESKTPEATSEVKTKTSLTTQVSTTALPMSGVENTEIKSEPEENKMLVDTESSDITPKSDPGFQVNGDMSENTKKPTKRGRGRPRRDPALTKDAPVVSTSISTRPKRAARSNINYSEILDPVEDNKLELLPPFFYENQPYAISLDFRALLLMTLHSHLCEAEIIGYLGGSISKEGRLHITRAYPGRSLQVADEHFNVEFEPKSQFELIEKINNRKEQVLGWYHSHPCFETDPSRVDVENHGKQKSAYKREDFIGAIIGPYKKDLKSSKSDVKFFTIENDRTFNRVNGHGKPYKLEYKLEPTDYLDQDFFNEVEEMFNYYQSFKSKIKFGTMWDRGMTHRQKFIRCVEEICEDNLRMLEASSRTRDWTQAATASHDQGMCEVVMEEGDINGKSGTTSEFSDTASGHDSAENINTPNGSESTTTSNPIVCRLSQPDNIEYLVNFVERCLKPFN